MVHDQATVQELKSMFAEMKELLQQQVMSPPFVEIPQLHEMYYT